MKSIRFIHTADLHLGSPLKSIGQASESIRQALLSASFRTLTRIVDVAIEEAVDFILIAGDLYDSEARSIQANKRIADEMARLHEQNISAFIIAGNHDPIGKSSSEAIRLPENTVIFSSESVETHEVFNDDKLIARVLGQSYRGTSDNRKMYSGYTVPDTSVWNIGLLHTALNEQATNYVPCTKDDLRSKDDIHYWALGHIHQQQIIQDHSPVIAYPGIPQGRDVGEPGAGSVLLVELSDNVVPDIRSIPVGEIMWREESINIGDASFGDVETLDDLVIFMQEYAENRMSDQRVEESENNARYSSENRGMIVRWHITGRGNIHSTLAGDRIESAEYISNELRNRLYKLSPFLWTESVQIHTGPKLPALQELASDYEFFEFLQSVIDEIKNAESIPGDVEKNLGKIWDASMDMEDPDEDRFLLSENILKDFLDDAEQRVIAAILAKREDL